MFCPNCGKELQDSAKFCPGCGTKLSLDQSNDTYTGTSRTVVSNENQINNMQVNPARYHNPSDFDNLPGGSTLKPKKSKKKIIIIILAIIIIPIIFFGIISDSDDSSDTSFSKSVSDETYISCAKQVVAEQLRSPGSASFSNCEVAEKDDYGRVLVTGYVDSQNGFGATLRNGFAVVITNYDSDTEQFSYSRSFELWKWEFDFLKDTTIENVKSNSQWNEPKETETTT
ncbi:MAG: zinc ribbon domain-containing protein [Clostridia bacterium]|nr:zinc ribbon domain-containing protein [Clostridia bacterium]